MLMRNQGHGYHVKRINRQTRVGCDFGSRLLNILNPSRLMRTGRLAHLSRTNHTLGDIPPQQQAFDKPYTVPNTTQEDVASIPRPLHPSTNTIPHYSRWELKPQGTSFPSADGLFVAESQFDASPEFVRPTSMCIGSQPNKWKFPLGGWFMPFGGEAVPSIRVTAPPRCVRCKAYLNAFFKTQPNGTVCCNICSHRYIPAEKIDPTLLANGELMTQGVVDFKVTDPIYIKKSYDQVKILIALECTKATIDNNLFENIIQGIKASIQSQFDPAVRMGIAVYDQSTHFYRVKSLDRELVEYTVGDPTGAMCPLPDSDLFFQLSDEGEKAKLNYLLDRLSEKAKANPNIPMSTNYFSVLSCLSTAFGAHSGRIVLFSIVDPVAGPGKLRHREKEQLKTPLKPLNEQYVNLSKELVKNRVGVDHFVFGRENMYHHQLASTHFLSTSTGGSLHYYTVYNPEINGDHLHFTIFKTLTKEYAYDVDFTCRVSNGLSVSRFIIAEGIREERDVSLGCFDSNQSIGVTYIQEDKLAEVAFSQFAFMFTNGHGERVIRVINYRLQVVDRLEQIHQGADYLAVANIIGKLAVNHLFKVEPQKVLEELMSSMVEMLTHYKNEKGQVKFSELQVHPNLKSALSYLHALVSSCLFTNLSKLNSDRRIQEIVRINSLGFRDFANKYYPKLYCIDLNIYNQGLDPGDFLENDPDVAILPPTLPLTNSSIKQDSAYLVQDNDYIYVFVMSGAPQELLEELFGESQLSQLTTGTGIPELETQIGHNIRISNVVGELRRRNTGLYLPILVLTPLMAGLFEQRMLSLLKEDNKERGYLFFLKHLHSRVQTGK